MAFQLEIAKGMKIDERIMDLEMLEVDKDVLIRGNLKVMGTEEVYTTEIHYSDLVMENANIIVKDETGTEVLRITNEGTIKYSEDLELRPKPSYPHRLQIWRPSRNDLTHLEVNWLFFAGLKGHSANVEIQTRGSKSTDSLKLKSYDGTTYRRTIMLVGGQMEVYSWDGSAEQLVAKTNAGYLEIARGKLTGDLYVNTNRLMNVKSIRGESSASPLHIVGLVSSANAGNSIVFWTKDSGDTDKERVIITGGVDTAKIGIVNSYLFCEKSSSTDYVLQIRITGEDYNRLNLLASGKIEWGSGTTSVDTNLYRAGSGILQTDGVFYADQIISNKGGLPRSVLAENGEVRLVPLDANSTDTLRNSPSLVFYGKYWDGTSSVIRYATVLHRLLSTTPTSEIAFQIAGSDYFRIGDEGVVSHQDVVPDADNTRTLGRDTLRWANVYAVTTTIGDLVLEGRDAKWRLFEREDGLYVKNEKTGKLYRIKLEEVD